MTLNQRVSPALIGAFVLGAVLLAMTAVVLLGSGRFFRRTSAFVLYFPGSVNGQAGSAQRSEPRTQSAL